MAKNKKLNPLDQGIQKWIQVFTNIDGFANIATDQDQKDAVMFITTQLESLNQSRQLTINNFVPAVNKLISDTRGYLSNSIYKQYSSIINDNLLNILDDKIRQGYVMFFHKYENFISEYIKRTEVHSEEIQKNTGLSIVQHCKIRFNFDPRNWWEFPVIHQVNFISNCTKHHNGKCKLKDSKSHSKPAKYLNTPDSQIIKPTMQEFKDDTLALMNSISNILLPIFKNVHAIVSSESLIKSIKGLIKTCEKAARLYENSGNETFIHEGKMYPLYEGGDLEKQLNIGKDYRNKIKDYKLQLQVYYDRITTSTQIVEAKINLYKTGIA